jgi:DNA-binding CsgD family transcriptional regulator
MDKLATWTDFKKWWTLKENNESGLSLNDLQLYGQHPLIAPSTNINNTTISVLDIKTMKYIYVSPNFYDFLGWAKKDVDEGGAQFAFGQIHPEDQHGVTLLSEKIKIYFKNLPTNRKLSYKAFWDYKIKNTIGEYQKVLQQDCVLKYTGDGDIEVLLVVGVKIDNVISDTSQHLRLTDGVNNSFYKYEHSTKSVIQLNLLTAREMEIVKLIAKSKPLKQIAAELEIKFNTVKAHSTKMMQKLQVKDSLEMVNLLRVWGFI